MIWQCESCGAEWGEYAAKCSCNTTPTAIYTATPKVASTGGSSAYYKIPPEAEDLQDLIELKEMSFARGNLFKALYRMGEKEGIDVEYDLNKLQWFLDRLRKMNAQGLRV